MSQKPLTYADAGVSIAAGNALVKAIAPLAKSTARPGANAELGEDCLDALVLRHRHVVTPHQRRREERDAGREPG